MKINMKLINLIRSLVKAKREKLRKFKGKLNRPREV